MTETAKKTGFAFLFPVILMVFVNVAYNIVAKLTPAHVNAVASVFLTYTTCCVASFIFFFTTAKDKNYGRAIKKCNWSAPAMGLSLVLMEIAILLPGPLRYPRRLPACHRRNLLQGARHDLPHHRLRHLLRRSRARHDVLTALR